METVTNAIPLSPLPSPPPPPKFYALFPSKGLGGSAPYGSNPLLATFWLVYVNSDVINISVSDWILNAFSVRHWPRVKYGRAQISRDVSTAKLKDHIRRAWRKISIDVLMFHAILTELLTSYWDHWVKKEYMQNKIYHYEYWHEKINIIATNLNVHIE